MNSNMSFLRVGWRWVTIRIRIIHSSITFPNRETRWHTLAFRRCGRTVSIFKPDGWFCLRIPWIPFTPDSSLFSQRSVSCLSHRSKLTTLLTTVIDRIGEAATLQAVLVQDADEFCFLVKKLPDNKQISIEGKGRKQENLDLLFQELSQLFGSNLLTA